MSLKLTGEGVGDAFAGVTGGVEAKAGVDTMVVVPDVELVEGVVVAA